MKKTTLLLAKPNHFAINYIINPWMEKQINQARQPLAEEQWHALYQHLQRFANIELIDSSEKLPDLCFTANAALIKDKTALISRFRPEERRPEELIFHRWLSNHGFTVIEPPTGSFFEGAGDALINHEQSLCWLGYGFRSDDISHFIEKSLNIKTIALKLNNPYFYHLDTCFCPLIDNHIMFYPGAFDDESIRLIEENSDSDKHIIVSKNDAEQFSCNAISIKKQSGDNIIVLNNCSEKLKTQLNNIGYKVVSTPMSEFMKAGGATKCLSLEL